MNEDGAVGF